LAHEYKLHRETFYLAVDYVDRYMSLFQNVPRLRLQLVGATAMWVASKYEVSKSFNITETNAEIHCCLLFEFHVAVLDV